VERLVAADRVSKVEKRKPPRKRALKHLSCTEREEVSRHLSHGHSLRAVAKLLGRAPSTVSREVKANGGRLAYRAFQGEESATIRSRRPREVKLVANTRLRREVEHRLIQRWSPQQISARLRDDFPVDKSMRVSHETIYQTLYIQARGALRKELTACLRTERAHRKPHGRSSPKGLIANMVMISERPPEVADRAVPGHWEGDLIIGKGNKSAIGTLVERHSRFLILLHLPNGRTADLVGEALKRAIRKVPEALRRSVTWDQGKELAHHASFSVDTNVKVFFCDPHSPWQRGSNENTNGLLRQYFPKATDLSQHSAAALARVARELNSRPRQTLNWMTPSEVFEQAVASTT
jgi:transposase, IS30 family